MLPSGPGTPAVARRLAFRHLKLRSEARPGDQTYRWFQDANARTVVVALHHVSVGYRARAHPRVHPRTTSDRSRLSTVTYRRSGHHGRHRTRPGRRRRHVGTTTVPEPRDPPAP